MNIKAAAVTLRQNAWAPTFAPRFRSTWLRFGMLAAPHLRLTQRRGFLTFFLQKKQNLFCRMMISCADIACGNFEIDGETVADQTIAKYLNELTILTMLRVQGQASRIEIARHLSVTPATITRLVNNLIERGLVQDVELANADRQTAREPGRPATNVALNAAGAFFFGVEVGVEIIRFALVDLAANVVQTIERPFHNQMSPERVASEIGRQVNKLKKNPIYSDNLKGVGIAFPGIVRSDGFVVNLPLVGWRNVDFPNLLSQHIDLPFFIENDANAGAFGCVYNDPSLPNACNLFLKLDVGCGGAAIVDGRLLRGANGTAGEFGHLRLSDDGPLCGCGNRGCLESKIGLGAIARQFLGVHDLSNIELAHLPERIVEAARNGDIRALETMDSFTHWLALGLVSLVNLYNPSIIFLGGPVAKLAQAAVDRISQRVRDGVVSGIPAPTLMFSALDAFEGAIGAASIAHHHTFDISRVGVIGAR
ncbi:ROK family protein [Rhizobium sp. NPDC090279]|uniref:ROK family transcriptional regulator n=1 Tax=Rhizobium sp. NPDC090279 TaxID=3364499 RepID=UPI003839E870